MRVREARERYERHRPARGEVLLAWTIRDATPAEHEALFPSLAVAMQTAGILATDPRCGNLWIYDGRRLYDHQAITGTG